MSAKEITKNLYLGDMHSIPEDANLVLSCAQEIFLNQKRSNDEKKFQKDSDYIYYNFADYPETGSLDKELITDVLKTMENNINDKKIYVHCIWGVNRSASIVFMYSVRNKVINFKTFDEAKKNFLKIYPNFSPNPGWREFLIKNFPYDF